MFSPIVLNKMEKDELEEIIKDEFISVEEMQELEEIINDNDIDDISYEYEGYLEIPKFNIKRLIKKGETEDILSKNYVLYYNSFVSLDKNNFNIILLGHNIESVFRFLHYLDIDDEIILVTHKNCYQFEVYDINIIPETETSVLNETHDNKTLTLITCMKNNKNRLLLRAKLKNM